MPRSFEREARHVVISLVLILIGAGLWFLKVPKAEDLIPFAPGVLARSMIKRLGTPEDIAWCAVYLASDESSWVTAADFAVDGGATRC